MTFSCYLFDLDGTLVNDPLDYWAALFDQVSRTLKLPLFDKKEIPMLWYRMSVSQALEEKFGPYGKEFMNCLRRLHNASRKDQVFAYGDAEAVLALKAQGKRLGVITGSLRQGAAAGVACLEQVLNHPSLFDLLVLANEDGNLPRKPAPNSIYAAMTRLSVMPAETCYVGDHGGDILAAKAAGVFGILIDRGENPYREGIEADRRITSLWELVHA